MKIGFLGAGKMAGAIARGILASGLCRPDDLAASDHHRSTLSKLAADTGLRAASDNPDAAKGADAILLCVKPADAAAALAEAGEALAGRTLISIVAGLTTERLEELAPAARVVRAMPNTAATVGRSATSIAPGKSATDTDIELAEKILSAVGKVFRVAEKDMNAITALSGSGPAFIYLILEAMADGAVAAGLSRTLAHELAVETLAGSAEMAEKAPHHPAVLREMVTSPGGTTIAGLLHLEKAAVRAAFAEAVRAAANRAEELSRQ